MASNKDKGKEEIKIDKHTRLKDIEDPLLRKQIFKEAKEGKYQDNKHLQVVTKNLIPINERPIEEQKEIRRKAAEATNKIKGEKKNAKQILDNLLPIYANKDAIKDNDCIPLDIKKQILDKNIQITQYDLIMLAQIHQAQQGNTKASEFIRDTYGDKPVNETHNVNEIMTQADKDLINKLSNRLNIKDKSVIDVD